MDRTLTDQSLVDAYNSLDMDVVRRIAVREDTLGDEAKKLLVAKEKYPVVSSVEFWWLDDHVERIEYGKHTSENNETISIFWKCGISQTAPSGVLKPTQNPRHKAALWKESNTSFRPMLSFGMMIGITWRRNTNRRRQSSLFG